MTKYRTHSKLGLNKLYLLSLTLELVIAILAGLYEQLSEFFYAEDIYTVINTEKGFHSLTKNENNLSNPENSLCSSAALGYADTQGNLTK